MGFRGRKKLLVFVLFISLISFYGKAQSTYIVEGETTDFYNVPRSTPILLIIKNCLFESEAENGYVLLAGDDSYVSSYANNLDNASIIGNKFVWNGYSQYPLSVLHGAMLGYNINYFVQHNYNLGMPLGYIYKSGNELPMEWTDGVHAYNIHKNLRVSVVVKGMSGVKIYNNTFYNDRYSDTYHIGILENNSSEQNPPYTPASNTKIYNNVFYHKSDAGAISLKSGSQDGLGIDYNIYWCEDCIDNQPRFKVAENWISWEEWRQLGYDEHSVIMDPKFVDIDSFVPKSRLNYGILLDTDFDYGLSRFSKWDVGEYPDTVRQNGEWQVGAVIYGVDDNSISSINSNGSNFEISIYPNPAKTTFTIKKKIPYQTKNLQIKIVSPEGVLIAQETLFNYENTKVIDVSLWSAGIYFVNISGTNITKKLVKLNTN